MPANSQSKKVKTKHSLNNANSKKRMIQYIGLKMFAIAYFLAKMKSFSLNKDRYVRSLCYIHVKDSDYILITSFPNFFIFLISFVLASLQHLHPHVLESLILINYIHCVEQFSWLLFSSQAHLVSIEFWSTGWDMLSCIPSKLYV